MLVVVGPFHNVALAHGHPCFYASFILCDTSCFKKKEMPEKSGISIFIRFIIFIILQFNYHPGFWISALLSDIARFGKGSNSCLPFLKPSASP